MCFGRKIKKEKSEEEHTNTDIFDCFEVRDQTIDEIQSVDLHFKNLLRSSSSKSTFNSKSTNRESQIQPPLVRAQSSEKCIPYIYGNQTKPIHIYEPKVTCPKEQSSEDNNDIKDYLGEEYYKGLLDKIPELIDKSTKKKIEIDSISLDTSIEDNVDQFSKKKKPHKKVADKLNKTVLQSNISPVHKNSIVSHMIISSAPPLDKTVDADIETKTNISKHTTQDILSISRQNSPLSEVRPRFSNYGSIRKDRKASSPTLRGSLLRPRYVDTSRKPSKLLPNLIQDKNQNHLHIRCRDVYLLHDSTNLKIDSDFSDSDFSNSDITDSDMKNGFYKLKKIPNNATEQCCGCQSSIWFNDQYEFMNDIKLRWLNY